MTEQATDKTEGEARKSSPLRIAMIILAVPVLAAVFISGVILCIVIAFTAFWFVVYILAIFWGIFHYGGPQWLF